MNIEINELNTFSRELIIDIPWEELSEDFDKTVGKFRKKAKLPGFRPGKVPKQVLMTQFLPAIEADFVEESFRKFYVKALQEKELIPVNQADVNNLEFKYGEHFSFKAAFEVEPEVTLPNLKKCKLEVQKHSYNTDEEDIELAIDDIRKANAEVVTVEDGAKCGDYVLADLQMLDDSSVPIIGEKVEKRYLKIGDGMFTGENQKNLEGVKTGDSTWVMFPDENGKESTFTVNVINIERQLLPEINGDFIKKLDPDVESETELRQKIKKQIDQSYSRRSDELFERQLSDALIEKVEIDCPPSMLEFYMNQILEDVKKKNDNVEVDEAKIRETYKPMTERNLKWYLIRKAIIQSHNLEVTKSRLKKEINQIVDHSSNKKEAEKFYKKPSNRTRIEDDLMEKKVLAVIQEFTKVKEVTVETKDIRAQQALQANTHE